MNLLSIVLATATARPPAKWNKTESTPQPFLMLFIHKECPCLASRDKTLETRADVAFTGRDFKVTIYDARIL
jgi:hypothetical protein